MPPDRPGAAGLTGTDHVLALAGLLLVVVALWVPFGLGVGPTFEEWKALYWSAERGQVPVVFPNRPLHYLPHTLAHLTGRPLLTLNLMQAGAMLGKGALVYLLVARLLPAGGALAFLAGVLAIVYPADTGLFTLRTLQLHLALFLDLVAIHLLLSLWGGFHWWRLVAVWMAQALGLALHLASIPILLASPVLLVWQERRVTRRLLATWAAWSVVPLAFLAVTLAFTLRGDTYEAGLWAASGLGPGLPVIIRQVLGRMLTAYARHFAGGWAEALGRLGPLSGDTGLALATAALAVGPPLWWHSRRGPAPGSWRQARPYLELAALALCAMPVGFLLFLPTRWMTTNWRVFFQSSVAAAIVVAVLCGLLAATAGRWRRLVLVGLGGTLVALALTAALAQHRGYAETAWGQQRLLAGIVREAPNFRSGTTLLVIDVPPHPGLRHWRVCRPVTECLEMSLRYVYARMDLDTLFCAPGRAPGDGRSEMCRFERDEVVVTYRDPRGSPRIVVRRYPYDRLVVFETSESGARLIRDLAPYRAEPTGIAYVPDARIDRAATPSRLARAMLFHGRP